MFLSPFLYSTYLGTFSVLATSLIKYRLRDHELVIHVPFRAEFGAHTSGNANGLSLHFQ